MCTLQSITIFRAFLVNKGATLTCREPLTCVRGSQRRGMIEKTTGHKKTKFKMYLGDLTPLHFAAFTGAYEIQTYRKNPKHSGKYWVHKICFSSVQLCFKKYYECFSSLYKLWSQLLRVIRRGADIFLKQQSWFYFILFYYYASYFILLILSTRVFDVWGNGPCMRASWII